VGSRSLDAAAETQRKVVSRPLGSRSSNPGPGFSVDWRSLALRAYPETYPDGASLEAVVGRDDFHVVRKISLYLCESVRRIGRRGSRPYQ